MNLFLPVYQFLILKGDTYISIVLKALFNLILNVRKSLKFGVIFRTCPIELQESIASVIFAAPRCSDVQELTQIKNLFTSKYGKEFVSAVSELRPDSGVNRVVSTQYWYQIQSLL